MGIIFICIDISSSQRQLDIVLHSNYNFIWICKFGTEASHCPAHGVFYNHPKYNSLRESTPSFGHNYAHKTLWCLSGHKQTHDILSICLASTQIARFIGPTWGPPGSCRPQMGPMLAPWTLLSGKWCQIHYFWSKWSTRFARITTLRVKPKAWYGQLDIQTSGVGDMQPENQANKEGLSVNLAPANHNDLGTITENPRHHDANFVVTGGIEGCCYDDLQCH